MRKFQWREKRAQNDAFGSVDYTITDTLTEVDGGVLVETVTRGVCEGDRVDQKGSKFWPGAKLENAVAGRLRQGWTEIK